MMMYASALLLVPLTLLSLVLASPLTTSRGPANPASLLNDTSQPSCIDDLAFLTPNFNPNHCWKAVRRLIDEYAWPEGQTQYEFLPPNDWVFGDTDLPKKRTAQKWDYGTCVAAIITLSAFVPGEFPFASWMTPMTDVGTYGQAAYWAEYTARACIETRTPVTSSGASANSTFVNGTETQSTIEEITSSGDVQPSKRKRWRERVGYTITGQKQGLGVFIWAKGSNIDFRFENHIPD